MTGSGLISPTNVLGIKQFGKKPVDFQIRSKREELRLDPDFILTGRAHDKGSIRNLGKTEKKVNFASGKLRRNAGSFCIRK